MSTSLSVNQLRAFVDSTSNHGNPTGIILDLEQNFSPSQRQTIATKLHFTDTVFVNRLDSFIVSFFNPQQETKFAGDALISTAYFSKHVLKRDLSLVSCRGGNISTWTDDSDLTWIEASLRGTPGWQHLELPDPRAVRSITPSEAATYKHTMVWAWEDKNRGTIVSRTFLLDWGTLEDHGNGSGSMQLAASLGRQIMIKQAQGSVIYAAPSENCKARVGGRVAIDQIVTITV